jgi:hypothetical protein
MPRAVDPAAPPGRHRHRGGGVPGLFGVGGGTIIVPLLVLWLACSGSPRCRSFSPCSSCETLVFPPAP